MKKLLLAAAAAVVGLANVASAAVVYQSIPDLTVAPYTADCSECNGDAEQVGQMFNLAAGASIGSVLFDVTSNYHWPSPVTLSVYADGGSNTLGAQRYSETYSSFASDTTTLNNTDIVGVNTPGLTLAAGIYALFLTNPSNLEIPLYMNSTGGIDVVVISSTTPPPVGSILGIGALGVGLSLQSNSIAVPEPASFALLGAGLFGLGAIRRKRAQKQAAG